MIEIFGDGEGRTEQALLHLGIGVALVAPMALLVRFSPVPEPVTEMEEKHVLDRALAGRGKASGLEPAPERIKRCPQGTYRLRTETELGPAK